MGFFSSALVSLCVVLSFSTPSFADEGWAFGENFYEIEAGQFYRSAQLASSGFEKYVKKYGIRTVINLRGPNPTEDWYRNEVEVLRRLNVNLISIPMSASRLPHQKDLLVLLDAFQNAPRPFLVHCQAGADRTGEAAALYQMLYMGKSKTEAMRMLSIQYGHIANLKPAKDYFIKEVWQGVDWAFQTYNPCLGQYRYYDVKDPACHP